MGGQNRDQTLTTQIVQYLPDDLQRLENFLVVFAGPLVSHSLADIPHHHQLGAQLDPLALVAQQIGPIAAWVNSVSFSGGQSF